ncbi:hypothetical protein [Roseivirga sp.]|uniref:hypothetical protein n=1 Tax=Roseivirga sp. TaxID=1964215 RepID=UPI003B522C44
MKTRIQLLLTVLLAAFVLQVTGCKNDDDVETEPTAGLASGVQLSTNQQLGTVMTDDQGRALYFFSKDFDGTSKCTDGCSQIWPTFYVENLEIGAGLDQADFGQITRTDGELQTTYKGWPLYYYSSAGNGEVEAAGSFGGEAINNVWFTAKPDYSIMIANAQLTGHDGNNYTSNYTQGDGETMFFVDAEGRTLYSFMNDRFNDNNFTAQDFSNNGVWPIFFEDLGAVPSIVNSEDFGSIEVFGQQQLTFKGWPLYYFGQDNMTRGSNKGVSFPAPGVWPIVNTSTTEATPAASVKLAQNSTFGEIMTDTDGQTLYFFARDANGANNCSGGCAALWPVFHKEEIILEAGSDLNMEDFSEITLSDGTTKQTTYKGWPLYYYSPNANGELEATGTVSGDGFNNVWFVAKENYGLMQANEQLVGHDGMSYKGDYTQGEEITLYFTDDKGRTLYSFTNDTRNDNNFTAQDFSNDGVWPIYYTDLSQLDLPSSMDKADFGEIDVFGRKQLTFKGWPVYYFGQDSNRGDNKGVSFPAPGVWPVINNSLTEAQ